MLESEGIEQVLPEYSLINQGVEFYKNYYSKEQEASYGLKAFKIRLIK